MNKSKKIIALLLSFMMISTTFVAAEFNDLNENSYADEISFMNQIGVLNGYTDTMFSPEQQFTRAEFLLALMRLTKTINYTERIEPAATEDGVREDERVYHYTDVAPHYIAEYINSAYTYGVIDDSDGPEFRPNDRITYSEAMKWMVKALGYGRVLATDSDSSIYTQLAKDMDLLDGVKISLATGIRRDEGAGLLFNMLTAPLCNAGVGSDGRFTTAGDEKTLMEDYYKLKKIEGVVMAYDKFSLSSTVSASEDCIVIGENTFTNGTTGMGDVLGCKVTAYYGDVEGSDTVQIIIKKDNPTMELTAENDYSFNASASQYEYYLNGKSKIAKVNADAYVVFNGAPMVDMTDDVMEPAIGKVTLIDNNNESGYEVVIVQSVENFHVDSINAGEMIVADKNGRTICLNPDDKQNDTVVLSDTIGKEKSFSDIKIGNVISVMASKGTDDRIIRAYISTATASGTISTVSEEENKNILTVNEEEYPVDLVSVKNTTALVGRRATLYLDMYGNVAWINLTGTEYLYAYVVRGTYDEGAEIVNLRLMMADSGKIETFEVADKVVVEEKPVNKADIINNTNICQSGKFVQQLIKIKLNSDNKINFIDIATNNFGNYSGFTREEFTLDYKDSSVFRNKYLFADKYVIDTATTILRVPTQDITGGIYETENKFFCKITKSDLSVNENYSIALYDLDESREPAVCVLFENNSGGTYLGHTYDKLIIPTKIGQRVNADNDIVKFVGYYNDSGVYTEKTFSEDCSNDEALVNPRLTDYLKENYSVDDIEVGFAIRAQSNANGEINNFRVHFDPVLSRDSDGELIYYEGGTWNDGSARAEITETSMYFHCIYDAVGEICEVDYDKSVIFNAHKNSDGTFDESFNRTFWKKRFMTGEAKVTIVEDGIYRVGAWTDLAVNDKVYVRAYRAEALEFLIFR